MLGGELKNECKEVVQKSNYMKYYCFYSNLRMKLSKRESKLFISKYEKKKIINYFLRNENEDEVVTLAWCSDLYELL